MTALEIKTLATRIGKDDVIEAMIDRHEGKNAHRTHENLVSMREMLTGRLEQSQRGLEGFEYASQNADEEWQRQRAESQITPTIKSIIRSAVQIVAINRLTN